MGCKYIHVKNENADERLKKKKKKKRPARQVRADVSASRVKH
jgi:hypothetical protein